MYRSASATRSASIVKSAPITVSIPGLLTFTTTASPEWIVARWTCAIEAAASGVVSKSEKTSQIGVSAQRLLCGLAAARQPHS